MSKLGEHSHWEGHFVSELEYVEDPGYDYEVWFGEQGLKKSIALVNRHVDPSALMIDLGCGNGNAVKKMLKTYENVMALDYSESAVSIVKTRFP